jgi:hypothetical protein
MASECQPETARRTGKIQNDPSKLLKNHQTRSNTSYFPSFFAKGSTPPPRYAGTGYVVLPKQPACQDRINPAANQLTPHRCRPTIECVNWQCDVD